jgi:hypothetical protein
MENGEISESYVDSICHRSGWGRFGRIRSWREIAPGK